MKQKITYYALGAFALCLFTIILWEQVRGGFFETFNSTVEVKNVEPVELTLDALIEERAREWLKSIEAYDYAKTQVTEDVINELGKL